MISLWRVDIKPVRSITTQTRCLLDILSKLEICINNTSWLRPFCMPRNSLRDCMYREANRASFIGRPNSSCLAATYGKLVAIEITIKDIMGTSAQPSWQHNLPIILTSFAAHHASMVPPIPAARLNSLAVQLGNQLSQLTCLNRSGNRSSVPRNSYPHMRYLLHEWDGTHTNDTK